MTSKYGIGISSDGIEFGMSHGPFDFELDALAIEDPLNGKKKNLSAYIIKFDEINDREVKDTPIHIWYDTKGWVRIFPEVVHCDKEDPKTFIYIGRGSGGRNRSKWANPFRIGQDGTRDEVILKYMEWIQTQPQLLASLEELRGWNLGCHCYPEACHGDILIELANIPESKPYSVFSEKEREEITWEFRKYLSDAEDLTIKTNEWERYNWLTRDGIGREEIDLFMAGFTRGLAWGLFKAGRAMADKMREGMYLPEDDDIPF